MSRTIRRGVAIAAVCTAGFAGPAFGAHDDDHGPDVAPTWETAVDGGQRTDEVALFAVNSPTAKNGVESVYVTGVARKSTALEAGGVDDFDVLTTAYDAATGAERWNVRYDDALDRTDGPLGGGGQVSASDDRPVGMEIAYDNNLLHVVTDTGTEAVTLTYSASSGDLVRSFRVPGFSVEDTAISVTGSWLFEAGTSGRDFRVIGYENGPRTISIDDRPVKGRAFGADAHNDYDSGDIASWRTFVVTGQEAVFGSGGDAYTAAYRIDSKTKIWERRWASPDNRLDAGVATDMTYVRSLGHGVAFVTGKTFHPDRGFDLWVTALDARTGAPLWSGADGMRTFGGPALRDDVPVAVRYSDATGIVYVTGTSERGAPHARDIVTIAYDGRTGEQLAVAYAAGDISNGGDKPTDLTISADGSRVFVAAEVHNLLGTGGYRAGVFGYDARLRPAGRGLLSSGGSGVDQAAGVGVSLDGTRVLVGGGNDVGSTRLDHTAAGFPFGAFEPVLPEPVATSLAFTEESATSGRYDDDVSVAVRLVDASGEPLAGQPVSLTAGGDSAIATTDAGGVATRTVRLPDPGRVAVTANFAGTDDLLPSSASTSIVVAGRPTELTLTVSGTGRNKVLTASLRDDRGRALGGRTVVFTGDGVDMGSSTTNEGGVARLMAPPGFRGARVAHGARWAGDSRYLASSS